MLHHPRDGEERPLGSDLNAERRGALSTGERRRGVRPVVPGGPVPPAFSPGLHRPERWLRTRAGPAERGGAGGEREGRRADPGVARVDAAGFKPALLIAVRGAQCACLVGRVRPFRASRPPRGYKLCSLQDRCLTGPAGGNARLKARRNSRKPEARATPDPDAGRARAARRCPAFSQNLMRPSITPCRDPASGSLAARGG